MDAAVAFARFAANTCYEDLPSEVVQTVKTTFLDSLAVAAAGSTGPGIAEVIDLLAGWGGHKESSVLVYGHRLPAVHAAFANGAMARALDYNETYDSGSTHPTISVMPAAEAIAERVRAVNGKDFITAIAIAFEIQCRMSDAPSAPGHWIAPQLTGYTSSAAAAGKLLRLNADQLVNAFGIAYSQVAGGRQSSTERAHTRGLQGAFSAKGGVLSALLAKTGVTGPRESLEGEHGYYRAYYGGRYERAALVDGLGDQFRLLGISYKPYPSCRHLHCHILATLELVEQHDIRPGDVDAVTAYVGDFVKGTFEPGEVAYDPKTVIECQFSAPYVIATAILNRSVTLADFLGAGFRNPRVLDMARKIVPVYDASLSPHRQMEQARIEIRTRDGRTFASRRVEFAKGHPANPMSGSELAAKFRDCLAYTARPVPAQNIDKVIDMVEHLDQVSDVSTVLELMTGA